VDRFPNDFFDAGPPCWDSAKRRVQIAAVVLPLMLGAWAGRSVAIWRRRPHGPLVALFIVVGLIGLGAALSSFDEADGGRLGGLP
jgi:hypothetical protein